MYFVNREIWGSDPTYFISNQFSLDVDVGGSKNTF